uniref:Uncharacterized protein n=1 Tax=uncultured Nocardioidaceae bacterium TaxID=253824 RepID=A0A6J4LHR5_9ACTN|nr:MAG: hypothetical protein AVDCRST_MAG46-1431 [uncultured Nocardioidaceae bacterium]
MMLGTPVSPECVLARLMPVPFATLDPLVVVKCVATEYGGVAERYAPLHRWLRGQNTLTMTFHDVEESSASRPELVQPGCPALARLRRFSRAIVDGGWKTSRVRLMEESATWLRPAAA